MEILLDWGFKGVEVEVKVVQYINACRGLVETVYTDLQGIPS